MREMEDAVFYPPGALEGADHLFKKAASPNSAVLHQRRAGPVDRTADDGIAVGFLNGYGLPSDERLIDAGMAVDHGAVAGDALAGAHSHQIADPHLLDWQLDFLRAPHDARGPGLQVQKPFHRLRAAGLHNERQPFRENMIRADHYRDGEEGRRRITRPIKDEPDNAARDSGKCADLKQHMLVEDAAPQRLKCHKENVPPDA